MEFVRVTCLQGRLVLPPGDFEKDVLEEMESLILPKEQRERLFRDYLINNKFISVEDCPAPDDRSKIYAPSKKEMIEPVADVAVSKPEDILDQNTVTVKDILKSRPFSEQDVKHLLKREKKGKKRKLILEALKKMLKKGV